MTFTGEVHLLTLKLKNCNTFRFQPLPGCGNRRFGKRGRQNLLDLTHDKKVREGLQLAHEHAPKQHVHVHSIEARFNHELAAEFDVAVAAAVVLLAVSGDPVPGSGLRAVSVRPAESSELLLSSGGSEPGRAGSGVSASRLVRGVLPVSASDFASELEFAVEFGAVAAPALFGAVAGGVESACRSLPSAAEFADTAARGATLAASAVVGRASPAAAALPCFVPG